MARWRVAEPAEVRPGADYKLKFSFKLDLSQLPRPFQIGMAGQRDWSIEIEHNQKMVLQASTAAEIVKDASQDGIKDGVPGEALK